MRSSKVVVAGFCVMTVFLAASALHAIEDLDPFFGIGALVTALVVAATHRSLRRHEREAAAHLGRQAEVAALMAQRVELGDRFRLLTESAPAAVYELDAGGACVFVNEKWSQITGYPAETAFSADAWPRLVLEPDRPRVYEAGESLLRSEAVDYDYRIRRADGRIRWIRDVARPLPGGGAVGYLWDITEAREGTARAVELAAIIDASSDHVVVFEPGGSIRYSSPSAAAAGLVEGSPADRVGEVLAAADRDRYENEILPAVLRAGQRCELLTLSPAEGFDVPVSTTFTLLPSVDGVERIAIVARDVSELQAAQSELAHQATHDRLTGLPNRARLTDELDRAFARLRRNGGFAAVLFCDLDGFKTVNDTLGHDAGDELLQSVAERLLLAVRDTDLVARLGGDEFVVLCEGIDGEEDAAQVAKRIIGSLADPFPLAQGEARVAASIGVYVTGPRDEPDEVLANADAAMYKAKSLGKSRYEIYGADLEDAARRRRDLAVSLRRALDRDEFEPVFRPTYGATDGVLRSVDLLLQWRDATDAVLAWSDFAQVATESGIVVPLDRLAVRSATQQSAMWDLAGRSVLVWVPLSSRVLARQNAIDMLIEARRDVPTRPGTIGFEFDEALLMSDARAAARLVGALRDVGVPTALGNFTGGPSAEQLASWAVDEVRLHPELVRTVTTPSGRAVIASLVGMLQPLTLPVVACGVTDQATATAVAALGVQGLQGPWCGVDLGAHDIADHLDPNGVSPSPAGAGRRG